MKKYICSCCGKELDEWPAIASSSPSPYNDLDEEERKTLAEISDDFCVITYPDQKDRFIRCTLTQKVIDHCQDLDYGIWASLSEESFQNYKANFHNDSHETSYFGWLCTRIPGYDNTLSIPTTVYTRTDNQRPEVIPHDNFDHPFVSDYYNGITKEEAERRISELFHQID